MSKADITQRTQCPEEIACRAAIALIRLVSHGDADSLTTRLNDILAKQAQAVNEVMPDKRQEWYMHYRREMVTLATECAAWPGDKTVMKRGNNPRKGVGHGETEQAKSGA